MGQRNHISSGFFHLKKTPYLLSECQFLFVSLWEVQLLRRKASNHFEVLSWFTDNCIYMTCKIAAIPFPGSPLVRAVHLQGHGCGPHLTSSSEYRQPFQPLSLKYLWIYCCGCRLLGEELEKAWRKLSMVLQTGHCANPAEPLQCCFILFSPLLIVGSCPASLRPKLVSFPSLLTICYIESSVTSWSVSRDITIHTKDETLW